MSIPDKQIWDLWELMQDFDSGGLFEAVIAIGGFTHTMQPGDYIPEPNYDHIVGHAEAAVRLCREAGLPASLASALKFRTALITGEPIPDFFPLGGRAIAWTELQVQIFVSNGKELCARVKDELKGRIFFEITSKERHLYEQSISLLGEPVLNAFPDIADDFEEAGKCLALERTTACVFHLMRAAEGAASVVAGRLGGATQKEDGEGLPFGSLVQEIDKKVQQMDRGPTQDKWMKLRGYMTGMNRGFRTKVAHPGTFYGAGQAERIFGLTRSFLEEAEELLRTALPD